MPLGRGGASFGGVAAARPLLPLWGRVAVAVVMLAIIVVLLVLFIRLRRGNRKPEAEVQLLHDLLAADLLSEDGSSEESLGEFTPRILENGSERVIDLFMTLQHERQNLRDGAASFHELVEAVRRDPRGPEAAQMPSCAIKVADLKKATEAAAAALTERCRWELRHKRITGNRRL